MKIGFFGNPNNHPFMLARAVRRLGHDVRFVVVSPERLNRPEFRYPDVSMPYPPWIRDLTPRHRWMFLLPGSSRQDVLTVLNSCDACFLAEEGPALAAGLRVPYVATLTGSNLEVFADPAKVKSLKPQAFPRNPWLNRVCQALVPSSLIQRGLILPQREGIRRARFVMHYARGLVPNGDRLLDEIGVPEGNRELLLMTDLELVRYRPPPANSRLRVFCVARLTWKREAGSDLVELDYKGTDVLLRGFALLRKNGRVPVPELVLVRKGRHVAETLKLAVELGLANDIIWRDELSQTEVLEEYARADIVVDQLASSVVAMGGLDAMAAGRPLLANARFGASSSLPPDSPICQATTSEQVCAQLEYLAANPSERARRGIAGRHWVETNFSSDAVAGQLLRRLGFSP